MAVQQIEQIPSFMQPLDTSEYWQLKLSERIANIAYNTVLRLDDIEVGRRYHVAGSVQKDLAEAALPLLIDLDMTPLALRKLGKACFGIVAVPDDPSMRSIVWGIHVADVGEEPHTVAPVIPLTPRVA